MSEFFEDMILAIEAELTATLRCRPGCHDLFVVFDRSPLWPI